MNPPVKIHTCTSIGEFGGIIQNHWQSIADELAEDMQKEAEYFRSEKERIKKETEMREEMIRRRVECEAQLEELKKKDPDGKYNIVYGGEVRIPFNGIGEMPKVGDWLTAYAPSMEENAEPKPYKLYEGPQLFMYCDYSQCIEEGTLRCSKCKNAHYCSRECQKKSWRSHKKECLK